MNSLPRDTALKVIGMYQIIGGVIGLAVGLYDLIFEFRFNLFFLFYGTIALGLFLLSIFAGIACVYKKRQRQNLTVLNQIIQIISFSIFGFSYTYNSGLGVYVA